MPLATFFSRLNSHGSLVGPAEKTVAREALLGDLMTMIHDKIAGTVVIQG